MIERTERAEGIERRRFRRRCNASLSSFISWSRDAVRMCVCKSAHRMGSLLAHGTSAQEEKIVRQSDGRRSVFHISCHFPTQEKVRVVAAVEGTAVVGLRSKPVQSIRSILAGGWKLWLGRRTRPISASRRRYRRRSISWSFLYEVPVTINISRRRFLTHQRICSFSFQLLLFRSFCVIAFLLSD